MLWEILGGLLAYAIILGFAWALAVAASKDCESYYNDPDVHR